LACPALPTTPLVELMLTIRPKRFFIIARAAARTATKALVRLV